MARWRVSGVRKVRGKFKPISDTVQGAETSAQAMAKARDRYADAPELSVERLSPAKVSRRGAT